MWLCFELQIRMLYRRCLYILQNTDIPQYKRHAIPPFIHAFLLPLTQRQSVSQSVSWQGVHTGRRYSFMLNTDVLVKQPQML